MSDFKKMCERLNKKYYNDSEMHNNDSEKYEYAEKAVRKYIKKCKRKYKKKYRKDRILNLKCEAEENSFVEHFSVLNSGLVFFISILALLGNSDGTGRFICGIICIVAVISFVYFCVKYFSIYKWRGYILAAIKNIEKKMK